MQKEYTLIHGWITIDDEIVGTRHFSVSAEWLENKIAQLFPKSTIEEFTGNYEPDIEGLFFYSLAKREGEIVAEYNEFVPQYDIMYDTVDNKLVWYGEVIEDCWNSITLDKYKIEVAELLCELLNCTDLSDLRKKMSSKEDWDATIMLKIVDKKTKGRYIEIDKYEGRNDI
jgi:hypothetical protein